MLVRFSQLVVEQKWIKEIDINPMLASPERLIALDARVVAHEKSVRAEDLPRRPIRPYPTRYVSSWKMKDGEEIVIRPIRPEDEPAIVKFHETLSERTVYLRYLQALKLSQRVAHDRLTRICFIDYDHEIALVAEKKDPATGESKILGVSRLRKIHGTDDGEFAVLVSDEYQGQGLGTELVNRIIQVARQEKIAKIVGDVLQDNVIMRRICEKLGFTLHGVPDEQVMKVEVGL